MSDAINLTEHSATVKNLNQKIDELSKKNFTLEEKIKGLEPLADKNAKLTKDLADAKFEADKIKKEMEFEKLLQEAKACEAQRESYMAGDMKKFIELAQPVNTQNIGSGAGGDSTSKTKMSKDDFHVWERYNKPHGITIEEYAKANDLEPAQYN